MPLLNLGNRRSAQAGNAGEIGKLDYRIGNAHVGQGVFLTGTTAPIPVELVETGDFVTRPYFNGALSTTLALVQNDAPTFVHMIEASNISAADAFIQMFDAIGTNSVTLGTTTPTLSLFVPKGDAANRGAMDKAFPVPLAFSRGLVIAATTTATGNTAPATALVVNMVVR